MELKDMASAFFTFCSLFCYAYDEMHFCYLITCVFTKNAECDFADFCMDVHWSGMKKRNIKN